MGTDERPASGRLGLVAALCAVFALALADRAEAYIDPGVGSYAFQMLVALFFSVAFAVKAYWSKLKVLIARLLSRSGRGGDDGR
jgi:hypothetical protein